MINVKSITDTIFLNTTLPNPIWPFNDTATLKLESASSKTKEFLDANFPDVKVTYIQDITIGT